MTRIRSSHIFSALTVIAVCLFVGEATAQSSNILQAVIGDIGPKTKEINTKQMRQILLDHSAVVLDARPHAEFVNGHIPSAHNLAGPASEATAEVERLLSGDKSKALVLYCNGPFCQASRRMGDQLAAAGFTNVRRYQLGMPIWRALGGPTEIELEGVVRVFKSDKTAVFFDARSPEEYSKQSLPRAVNLQADKAAAVNGKPMPLDDFNTRIILFGRDAAQARAVADALAKRPWHNIMYFPGTFETLAAALKG